MNSWKLPFVAEIQELKRHRYRYQLLLLDKERKGAVATLLVQQRYQCQEPNRCQEIPLDVLMP